MNRRMLLLRAAAILVVTLAAAGVACAQGDYPSRTIRLVVPWSPGGVVDIGARIMADRLSKDLHNPVIILNKPGANGFIGTEEVAKAAPDGYTLLLISTTTHVVAPALYHKMPYDPIKDFEPISQIALSPTIAVAPPNSPFKTLADLVAAAKAHPGKLNYATYGAGGSAQLAATLFMQAAGIKMTAIPYKASAPAVAGLMGGETDLFFDSIPSSLNSVKAGRLKAFAVTSEARVPAAPDIPTLAEFYPGVTFYVWQGIEAPAGTPKPIVNKLYAEIVKVLDNPDVRDKMEKLGALAVSSKSPEEFGQFIASQKLKMENLIRGAGIPYVD